MASEPANGLSARVQRLVNAVPQSVATADSTVAHINRLLASSRNVDTTLVTVTYTLHLLHSILERVTTARLNLATLSLARDLKKNAGNVLLPGETLVATVRPLSSSRLVRLSSSLKALTDLIDDHRVFMRLWSLLGLWSWASRAYKSPPKDDILRTVSYLQLTACLTFQYLENGAYLASKNVIAFTPAKLARWSTLSVRFWAAHVFLEFVRLARVRVLRRQQGKLSGGEKEEDNMAAIKEEAKWWRDLYTNAAWAPLTLHYSLQRGWFGEGQIAALGMAAGWLGLVEAWKATA